MTTMETLAPAGLIVVEGSEVGTATAISMSSVIASRNDRDSSDCDEEDVRSSEEV